MTIYGLILTTFTNNYNLMKKIYLLIFTFITCAVTFAQVNSFPESSQGACDGYAQLTGNYSNISWYNQLDTINAIPPDSLNSANVYGLCAGNYYVNALDSLGNQRFYFIIPAINPCQSFSVNVQVIPTPDSSLCKGKAFANPVNGVSPFTYSWSNNSVTDSATNLCAGNYLLTVTDNNNCSFNTEVNIEVNPCFSFSSGINSYSSQYTDSCNGGATVWPINGKAPYSFSWSNNATTSSVTNLCPGNYQVTVTDSIGCVVSQIFTIYLDSLNGGPCGNLNLSLSPYPTTDTVNCNGSIYSYVNGGTQPYVYLWNTGDTTNNIFNKCAGEYLLTLTDANGCIKTVSQTIAYNGNGCQNFNAYATFISDASDSSTCNGSIQLGVNGGNAPFVYNWSNDLASSDSSKATNICVGNYNVTVIDFNNCSYYLTFKINVANNPCQNFAINTNSTPITDTVNCNGTVEVSVSSGNYPITYLWNDNSKNKNILGICNEGYYVVTVTDSAGCTATDSVFIGRDSVSAACANFTLNVNFTNTSPNICDGSANAVASGGTGQYGYSWSTGDTLPNISNLCPGTYFAHSIDFTNNCIKSYRFDIINAISCPNPPVVNVNGPSQIITGQTANLTASGAFSYSWSTGDSLPSINVSPNATTSYQVIGIDSLGCTDTAFWSLTVLPDTGNPCSGFTVNAIATNTSPSACIGTISVTTTSNNPLSFSWSDSLLTGANVLGLCAGTYAVSVTDLSSNCTVSTTAKVLVDSTVNPCLGFQVVIDSTLNETAPSAGNGQVYASTFGGTAPFLYNWGNGFASDTAYFSGMYGGSFNLTVKDVNGCSAIANGFVGTTAPINGPCTGVLINVSLAASIQTTSACNVTLSSSVNGGTLPYAYEWNNGYRTANYVNACAGNYSLLVTDANGCIGAASILINADTLNAGVLPLLVNIATENSGDTLNCNGSVRVNVSGGLAPYQILYNTGSAGPQLNGLCPDIYNVTVKDANGDSTAFDFVIAYSGDVFNGATNNPLNDSVVVATISSDAKENCQIDVNAIDSVLVTNYWIEPSNDSLYVEWTIYSITLGNTLIYQRYAVGPEGVYEVVLSIFCSGRATKGFVKAYDKVQVNARLTKLDNNSIAEKLNVYPNPFNQTIYIKLNSATPIEVKDLTGRIVKLINGEAGLNELNLESLSKGVYLIHLKDSNYIEVEKIVKQ